MREFPPAHTASPFRYFNTSPEVIWSGMLRWVRFPLSLRNAEDLLFGRESKFAMTRCGRGDRSGPTFADEVRHNRVTRMRAFRHWGGTRTRCP